MSKVSVRKQVLEAAQVAGAETMVFGLLRPLVDGYGSAQASRIQYGNRAHALESGVDTDSFNRLALDIALRYQERFAALEADFKHDISYVVTSIPVFEPLSQVAGIGPLLAAKIIAVFNIQKPQSPSAIWRFAGYGLSKYWVTPDGRAQAPEKGWQWKKQGDQKVKVEVVAKPEPGWELLTIRDRLIAGWCSPYSRRAKTLMHNVGTSFLKARGGSPYASLYREKWEYYAANRPDWARCATCETPLMECSQPALHRASAFRGPGRGWQTNHIHLGALRHPIKVFLTHLYIYWKTLEGLPVRPLYVHEKLGHTHLYEPADFGWPPLSSLSPQPSGGGNGQPRKLLVDFEEELDAFQPAWDAPDDLYGNEEDD